MKKIRLLLVLFFAFTMTAAAFNAAAPPPETNAAYFSSYAGLGGPTHDWSESETVYYSRREITNHMFNIPCYTNTRNNRGLCGPISGAIVAGYYSYWYLALVPNFTTYRILGGTVYYYDWDIEIDYMIDNLTNIMSAQTGVTVANYKIGLYDYFRFLTNKYINFNGVTQSGGNGLNWAACVSQLNAMRPLVLFMSHYNTSAFGTMSPGEDKIVHYVYVNNHIMTANGYCIVNYYSENSGTEQLLRTDYYLYVATGWKTDNRIYMGSNLTVDDAYGVQV